MRGILASIACGIVGGYVATQRITYIAGGIAHSVLAGMGAARYYQTVYQWDWLHPLYGAVAVAIMAAMIIGPNLPAGATTMVLAGAVYLAVTVVSRFFRMRRS